jgi:hypothetical protein
MCATVHSLIAKQRKQRAAADDSIQLAALQHHRKTPKPPPSLQTPNQHKTSRAPLAGEPSGAVVGGAQDDTDGPTNRRRPRQPPSLTTLRLCWQVIIAYLKVVLAKSPAFLWRVLEVAFSPSTMLRKLTLVSLLQLAAAGIKRLLQAHRHSALTGHKAALKMADATTFDEWEAAHRELEQQSNLSPLPPELQLYCRMLDEAADNYARLMSEGDMHALMFRLRSELMRGAAGGNG